MTKCSVDFFPDFYYFMFLTAEWLSWANSQSNMIIFNLNNKILTTIYRWFLSIFSAQNLSKKTSLKNQMKIAIFKCFLNYYQIQEKRNGRHPFNVIKHSGKLSFTLCFDKVQWIYLINLMVGEDELMIFVLCVYATCVCVCVCVWICFSWQQREITPVFIYFV